MQKSHGNFTPLKPLNSDTRATPTQVRRFTGTAKLILRHRQQYTFVLKVTDNELNEVVLEQEVKLSPDGGYDIAIMRARKLAQEFTDNL